MEKTSIFMLLAILLLFIYGITLFGFDEKLEITKIGKCYDKYGSEIIGEQCLIKIIDIKIKIFLGILSILIILLLYFAVVSIYDN